MLNLIKQISNKPRVAGTKRNHEIAKQNPLISAFNSLKSLLMFVFPSVQGARGLDKVTSL